MPKSLDKIKDTRLDHVDIINNGIELNLAEERKKNITFSFKVFCTKSIRNSFFNNCYETRRKSIMSSKYLFDAIQDLSDKTLKEIETNFRLKEKYHYHSIEDIKEIERIVRIQMEGYGINEDQVRNQENSYYQFEFGPNGYRLIVTKVGSIFIPLFIDNNHLVYNKSSKEEKKMGYKVPFVASDSYIDKCGEESDFEFMKELVDEYRRGEIASKEEFLGQWESAYDL